MKRLILLLNILLVLSLLVFACATAGTPEDQCKEASSLVDKAWPFFLGENDPAKRKPQEAIATYEEAIRLCPGYTIAHYNIALVLELTGQLDAALSRWKKYTEIATGKPSEAKYLEQAELHVRLIGYLQMGNQQFNLGVGSLKSREYTKALEAFTKAITQHTEVVGLYKNSKFYYNLGASYDLRGATKALLNQHDAARADLEKAVVQYQAALSRDPRMASSLFRLALALTVLGRYEEAYSQWKAYMKAVPSPQTQAEKTQVGLATEMEKRISNMIAIEKKLLEDEIKGLEMLRDRVEAEKKDLEAMYRRVETTGQVAEWLKYKSAEALDYLLILYTGVSAGKKGIKLTKELGVVGNTAVDKIARGFAGYAFGVTGAGLDWSLDTVIKNVLFDPTTTAIRGWELAFDALGLPIGSIRTQRALDEIKLWLQDVKTYEKMIDFMIIDRKRNLKEINEKEALGALIDEAKLDEDRRNGLQKLIDQWDVVPEVGKPSDELESLLVELLLEAYDQDLIDDNTLDDAINEVESWTDVVPEDKLDQILQCIQGFWQP